MKTNVPNNAFDGMVEHMFKNTPQQREADAGANALAEIGKTAKKVLRKV